MRTIEQLVNLSEQLEIYIATTPETGYKQYWLAKELQKRVDLECEEKIKKYIETTKSTQENGTHSQSTTTKKVYK